MRKSSKVPFLVLSCVLVLLCCLCVLVGISTGLVTSTVVSEVEVGIESPTETILPKAIVTRPEGSPVQVDTNTLEILDHTNIPTSNLLDLAQRFEGKENIPVALDAVSTTLQVGTQVDFWVTNTDTDDNFRINATLQEVTDHVYFWIQDGIRFKQRDLQDLTETFENQIYPTNREYFGSEWIPGVDGDPHIFIIYAEGLGNSVSGYFSPTDEYHPLAHEYSNMHETFMLNADNLQLDQEYTYGVLAHEFQHMIHWNQDRNEDVWINEGLSELASHLNGYDVGGFDLLYTSNPDLQLNDWPNNPDGIAPHYGASFLYMAYLLDRFGFETIQGLVRHPENGMSGVDGVLAEVDWIDDTLGENYNSDDVFLDWTLATYLNDERILDGRYRYYNYDRIVTASDTEEIRNCPLDLQTRSVHQYGADYIRIDCKGEYMLRFQGSTEVDLLPADPFSGKYAFWSNKGDDSNMSLTKTFDFRGIDVPLTLTYWTWYDLEDGYDYVYLAVSKDGKSWEILKTPSGTAEDPSGNSYGWAYNGLSGGDGSWIQEKVNLSDYAGEQVYIRFEYVTDGAVNGDGFLLDDLSISEIEYFSDFEGENDDWKADGFVRIQNTLPQTFRLALIEEGDLTQVKYIELKDDNLAEIPLNLDGEVDEVVLVVTGTTRYTRQVANYQFSINEGYSLTK